MKIVYGKHHYKHNDGSGGWYYEVKNDKIDRYCCDKMKNINHLQLGSRVFQLYEYEKELSIPSYDFDELRPIRFCMFCGEKIELEIID